MLESYPRLDPDRIPIEDVLTEDAKDLCDLRNLLVERNISYDYLSKDWIIKEKLNSEPIETNLEASAEVQETLEELNFRLKQKSEITGSNLTSSLEDEALITDLMSMIYQKKNPYESAVLEFYKISHNRRPTSSTAKITQEARESAIRRRDLRNAGFQRRLNRLKVGNEKIGRLRVFQDQDNQLFFKVRYIEEFQTASRLALGKIRERELYENQLRMFRRKRFTRSNYKHLVQLESRLNKLEPLPVLITKHRIFEKNRIEHLTKSYLTFLEQHSAFSSKPIFAQRYLFCNLIGMGDSCEVWKVYDIIKKQCFAAKLFNSFNQAMNEYTIHRRLVHENIVQIENQLVIGDGIYLGYFALLTELMDGSVACLMKIYGRLQENVAQNLIVDVINAAVYLELKGIAHLNLKPENLLIHNSGKVKISDFGSIQSHSITNERWGTASAYLPPEFFKLDQSLLISSKIDVWSIGMIFFEMLFGFKPFSTSTFPYEIAKATQIVIPENPSISQNSRDFLNACLVCDQESRPSIRHLHAR